MEAVTTLDWGRPLTVEDLATMPDDGHRYEVIDGTLVVTPAPSPRHQQISARLLTVLAAAAPPDVWVLHAPLDVVLASDTAMQPDLLVAPRSAFGPKDLPTAPLLAVEILSPSTRLIDLNLKRARYERAGVPSYWVVDPDGPRLVGWELRDGAYVEVADVSGDAEWVAGSPYEVRIVPARLLD